MTNTFVSALDTQIDKYDLLKHPFYLRWNLGELTHTELRIYAREYFHFVRAIPTYVSAIHSNCREHAQRLSILENLVEEETGGEGLIPHEELWVWFARGIGISRDELYCHCGSVATRKLMLTYRNLCNSSNCAVGAAAMYAYESRIPAVSFSKLEGLQQHYDIRDEETLQFFREHMVADIEHSKTWANLIARMANSEDDCKQIEESAEKAARALWRMLDGVCEQCDIPAIS
ncbi:MAG: CADD family putative folate metabolism protein [Candidatus Zixiibacteriota bacterium]